MSLSLVHAAPEGLQPNEFQSDIWRGTLRRIFLCYHCEGCMWSMQCNMEFGYQLSICSGTKENHGEPWSSWLVAGPSGCKLASSQQSSIKYESHNISPDLCCFFLFLSLKTFISCFYKHFYLNIIWISTKPYITPAEGNNAYLHKYAYKYTYIYICDSLIICNSGNPLHFVEIGYYTRFFAHPITKIMFLSLILLFFLPSPFHSIYVLITFTINTPLMLMQSISNPSQYVLASSPLCGLWTRYCFLFKTLDLEFVVPSLLDALSGERPSLFFLSLSQVNCLHANLLFTFLCFTHLPVRYISAYYSLVAHATTAV
jgi:hypothetical protein